jgi:uncharacterized protein with PIN domain
MGRKICVDCGEFMRVKKNGVRVRPNGYYGYFMADLWYCPKCGKEILELADEEIISKEKVEYDFTGDEI